MESVVYKKYKNNVDGWSGWLEDETGRTIAFVDNAGLLLPTDELAPAEIGANADDEPVFNQLELTEDEESETYD